MIKVFYTFCLIMIFTFSAHATLVSGIVSDEKNAPLPFANVYVKNTTNGTNANSEGKYTLDLTPGNYDLVFQYLGYVKQVKNVTVGNTPVILDVQLQPENINLKSVVINANAKDPAYAIIRHAQKKRKYYLDQVNGYSCDVYIKNVQHLDSFPKYFMGFKVTPDKEDSSLFGIIYLSESESQYNFEKPNNFREIMYSSKVSGNNKAFSWNVASAFQFNFYDNLLTVEGLSNRGFVSPISESAMLYYDYKLLGTFLDGNLVINKIQVIPKRQYDPVFSGIIYIIDGSWCIYSTDLVLTKDANIDFIDTLKIKQTFVPVNDSVWMPISQTFLFQFAVLGIKGNGSYLGIFKNYKINPVFPEHFFNNAELKVEDGANKKDSSYWSQARPLPLAKEERKDYVKKDSIERIHDSPAYKDSMDRLTNKFRFSDLEFGYTHYNSINQSSINFSSPLYNANFNTVEGLDIEEKVSFHKAFGDSESYSINGAVRYGFSDELWSAKIDGNWSTNPMQLATWSAGGGRFVQQVNDQNPEIELVNTAYSLFDRENYMKIYDNSYVYIEHEREVINGLGIDANLSYSDRESLFNTTGYNWTTASAPEYTPNTPQYLNGYADITHNTALTLKLTATIHFKQKYVLLPHKKLIVASKYPVLTISYNEGIPVFGANANYTLLEAGLKGDFKLGLLGTSEFSIKGGDFLTQQNLSFIDYAHFLGNQTYVATNYLEGFQLLPYYQYSTSQQFLEAHYEHHFHGFITNKIPLLRKLKLQEVAGIHLLETPDIRYGELSIGIEHILKLFRIDWVNSYSNTMHLKSGFVIGLSGLFGSVSVQ